MVVFHSGHIKASDYHKGNAREKKLSTMKFLLGQNNLTVLNRYIAYVLC